MTATTQIMTEADTCRELVTPKLTHAGWGNAPHVIGEQRTFTNGRIIVTGGRVRRGKQKRADYLLYYRRDYLSDNWGDDPLAAKTAISSYSRCQPE
jgi:type I restriction enzyme, R subunit